MAAHLMDRYGPLLDRDALVKILGFPSGSAFDRYYQRGHLQIHLVRLPHRRGVYALAVDVARYLVEVSCDEIAGERRDANVSKT